MGTPLEYTINITILNKEKRTQVFTWSITKQQTLNLLLISKQTVTGTFRP